jgi:hypothetical protein
MAEAYNKSSVLWVAFGNAANLVFPKAVFL